MQDFVANMRNRLINKWGWSPRSADIAIAVQMFETGGYSHIAAPHNYGGYSTSEVTPYPRPADEGGYYRAFNSDEEFADAWVQNCWNTYDTDFRNITDTREFVYAMKRNGYFTSDDVEGYLGGVNRYLGEIDSDPNKTNYYGAINAQGAYSGVNAFPYGEDGYAPFLDPDEVPKKRGLLDYIGDWDAMKDSFVSNFFDNGFVSMVRQGATMISHDADGNVVPNFDPTAPTAITDDAMSQAKAILHVDDSTDTESDRYKALEWAQGNAMDPNHFIRLAEMKAEDIAREERIANRNWSAARIVGGLGGLVVDPLNAVPIVGQEAFILKVAGKLGSKTAATLSTKTLAKMAELSLTNGLINVGDQYISNVAGGNNNQNYGMAFAFGAGATVGFEVLRGILKHKKVEFTNPETDPHLYEAEVNANKTSVKAIEMATDTRVPHRATKVENTVPDYAQSRVLAHAMEKNEPTFRTSMKVSDVPDIKTTLQERYNVDNLDDDTDLNLLLKDTVNGIEYRDDSVVAPLLKLGITNEQEAAAYMLAHNKTKGAQAVKRYFEDTFDTKLTTSEAKDLARRVKDGAKLSDYITRMNDGSINDGVQTHEPTSIATKIINNQIEEDPSTFTDLPSVEVEKPKTMEDIEKETQKGLLGANTVTRKAGVAIERNRFTGNRFGLLINSLSPTARNWAKKFGWDPRQSGRASGQVWFTRKRILQNEQRYSNQFQQNYKAWCREHKIFFPTRKNAEHFNEEINKAYEGKYNSNSTSNYVSDSKAINDAINTLHEHREYDKKIMKQFGVVDDSFIGSDELYRRVDYRKLDSLITEFKSADDFRTFLKDYALQATKWDDMNDMFRADYISRQDIDPREAEILMNKAHVKFVVSDKPMPTDGNYMVFKNHDDMVTYLKTEVLPKNDAMFKEFVAGRWAEAASMPERQAINIHGEKELGYIQARIPMDTTIEIVKPNGGIFSFSEDLRNNDYLSQMEYVANRTAGACALKLGGIDYIGGDLRKIYDQTKNELEAEVTKGTMSSTQMANELQAMRETMSNMSGATLFAEDIEPDTVVGLLNKSLLTNSFMQNGLGFGFNQIVETLNNVSTTGWRALTYYVPKLHDFIHDMKYSQDFTARQLRDYKDNYLGFELAQHMHYNPRTTSIQELRNRSASRTVQVMANAVDKLGAVAQATTGNLNFLKPLTELGISFAKMDILTDTMRWARGNFKSVMRSGLFSKHNLEEAGITDPDAFRQVIIKYLGNLDRKDPKALTKAMQRFEEEDFANFNKLHSFSELTAQRTIIDGDIWNKQIKYKGWLGIAQSMFWQFKNFTQMATNSHLMRILSVPQREDFVKGLVGAFGSALFYALSQFTKAETYYGSDEQRKQAYLNKTLSDDNIMRAAIFRNSILSGASIFNDVYEAATGSPTIRTTVDRSLDFGSPWMNAFAQTPAIATVLKQGQTVLSVPDMYKQYMSQETSGYNIMTQLFPLERYIPFQMGLAVFADEAFNRQRQKDYFNKRLRERKQRKEQKIKEREERINGRTNVQGKNILNLFK